MLAIDARRTLGTSFGNVVDDTQIAERCVKPAEPDEYRGPLVPSTPLHLLINLVERIDRSEDRHCYSLPTKVNFTRTSARIRSNR